MTNILITNSYSWYQKGDAGILMGMVNTLEQIFEGPKIDVLSFTPEIDNTSYPLDAEFYPDPLKISYGNSSKATKLTIPLAATVLSAQAKLKKSYVRKQIAQRFKEADLVLSVGGGFLGGYSLDSLAHVFTIYLATLYDKPTVIYAQSISEFGTLLVGIPTKYVLNQTDLIMPREEVSEQYTRQLNLEPDIEPIPDAAFMLDPDPSLDSPGELLSHGVPNDQTVVGMTAKEWHFPDASDSEAKIRQYKTSMVEAVTHLVNNQNSHVVMFPQVIFAPHDDDREIAREIVQACPEKVRENVTTLESDYTPPELISLIGECDFFVGTRMHSNIFATRAGVPTVAISYQAKTHGIMRSLDLDGWWVNINEIDPNNIVGLIERGMSNRETIQSNIERRVPELREEILDKSEQLRGFTD